MVYCMHKIKKFVYEYKFVPDSTNTSDIKSEITHLEITPKGSVFIVMKFIKVILWRKLIWKNNSKATGAINVKVWHAKRIIQRQNTKTYPDFKITQESSTTGKALKLLMIVNSPGKYYLDKQKQETMRHRKPRQILPEGNGQHGLPPKFLFRMVRISFMAFLASL